MIHYIVQSHPRSSKPWWVWVVFSGGNQAHVRSFKTEHLASKYAAMLNSQTP